MYAEFLKEKERAALRKTIAPLVREACEGMVKDIAQTELQRAIAAAGMPYPFPPLTDR